MMMIFASYAMLLRHKKAETAVHGCQQSDSLFFMVDLGVKPATNVAIVPNIVASSQLLAHLCYLYLTLNITDHFNCTTSNTVYFIEYSNCNKLYIGETGRRLGDRIRDNL